MVSDLEIGPGDTIYFTEEWSQKFHNMFKIQN